MTGMGFGQRTQGKVLVADWDRSNALTLAAAMHRAGLEVATVFNGKEAVMKAATFRPDLLVTEAYLGRLSGIEAAARITAALPDCKVLFVSGEATVTDIAKAAPPDLVFSFAPKRLHPHHLLTAIAYMLCAEWSTDDPGHTNFQPVNSAEEATLKARRFHRGEAESAAETQNHVSDVVLQQALL
jgi:CheY-like chemotaxis protein